MGLPDHDAPPLPAGLRRAVFLDRDGVLNRVAVRDGRPEPLRALHELELMPGVPEGLDLLRGAGFLLICATNQPDVSRGVLRREVVEAINARLVRDLRLDGMRVCWHDDGDGCACRKPKPGLLLDAARDHGIALPRSYMLGDRWRDIEAGQAAGCRTVWLRAPDAERTRYAERAPRQPADFVAASFEQAANWIVRDAELRDAAVRDAAAREPPR